MLSLPFAVWMLNIHTAKTCSKKQKKKKQQIVVIKLKHADNGFTFSIDLIGQIKSKGLQQTAESIWSTYPDWALHRYNSIKAG